MRNSRAFVWLKRILLGLLALLLLIVLLFAGTILIDNLFLGNTVTEVTNVTYQDSQGNTLYGYLARPEG
ncbi:MAG: hypothetical protein KDE29_03535, partial [Anaerolineales bacterium]|nr:hypothetical protein [Anaerolineales bacterium]